MNFFLFILATYKRQLHLDMITFHLSFDEQNIIGYVFGCLALSFSNCKVFFVLLVKKNIDL